MVLRCQDHITGSRLLEHVCPLFWIKQFCLELFCELFICKVLSVNPFMKLSSGFRIP